MITPASGVNIPAYAAVTREVRRIQDGVDRLVLGAERQYSRIAVHYSQRSWALSFPSAGIESHVNQLGTLNHSRYYREGYLTERHRRHFQDWHE